MSYINMVDINGKTYNLESLTDGEFEVFLPVLAANDEFILKSGVVNNLTSYETKKPLSAYQGRVLSTKISDLTIDMNNKFDDLEIYVNEQDDLLSKSIQGETERATLAENANANAIATEQSRAKGVEGELDAAIKQEATDRANAILAEETRAKSVESNHALRIESMEVFFKEADIDASQEFIDTLKEIQTYIADDKTGAESMVLSIQSKVDKVDGKGLSTNDYTTTEKDKLANIEAEANKYIHPSYDTATSGFYKITVDEFGHVSSVMAVSKDDIVNLGIPAQDTTYSDATISASGLLSSTDKAIYDGYDTLITELQKKINELEKRIDALDGGGATE